MKLDRVLIVDDDPLFLGVADALMRSLGGKQVDCHQSPKDALSQVFNTQDDIDLIICDLNMPDIDGIAFIRALSERGFPGPVIIVSAEADAVIKSVEAITDMLGVQLLGGLKKPLRQGALMDLINGAKAKALSERDTHLGKAEVRAALTEGRVIPVYQPQLNLARTRFDAVEVLCRVRERDGRLGSPAPLLNASERHGFMIPLTLYLMRRALTDLKAWLSESAAHKCSINISALALEDRSLPRTLSESVARIGAPIRQITLEVTEDHLLNFGPDTLEVLARLRMAGFGLSIDDFGTGATSLEQLKRFPFTELKIDRTYVQGNHADPFAREVLQTSARLAAIVGLSSVAEGVETPGDLAQIAAAGVTRAQGFMLARPMPAEEFARWRAAPLPKLNQVA
ncbi:MAG: EAL domain-containing response regulator [Pseudomonadota bacterium]